MPRAKKNKMFRYLEKYVGTYRILTDAIDIDTGKVLASEPSADDLYIPTSRKYMKVKHTYDEEFPFCVFIDDFHTEAFNKRVEDFKKKKFKYKVDAPNYIYFKEENLPQVMKMLGTRQSGLKIKPFSSRNNTKKDKYDIPATDLSEYRTIMEDSEMSRSEWMQFIKSVNSTFMKKNKLVNDTTLGARDFIHMSGLWAKYIKFIKKEVDKCTD